ncbi:hypothetical protein MMC14_006566 [Varicellaria rhodocarpa]|nr:hypothetical protein [Varicellaria rhodocarpa]
MADSPPPSISPRPMSPTLAPASESIAFIPSSTARYSTDEATPLLSTDAEPSTEDPPAAPSRSKKTYVLTLLSLILCVATLVLIGVAAIIPLFMFFWFSYPWEAREALTAATIITVISTLISSFNYTRFRLNRLAIPLAPNLILDIAISCYAISYGIPGIIAVIDGYRFSCSYWPGDSIRCGQKALPIRVVAGIALGTVLALGLVHFILFLMRCRAAFRSGFSAPWRFATGQFTFEFTVKVLREPQGETIR